MSRGLTETEIPIDASAFPPSVIQKLNEDPDATTYQFLLVGKPSEGERVPDSVSLAERLQRQAETLEAQYRELEQYTRSLEQQHREEIADLNRAVAHGQTIEKELVRIQGDFSRLGLNPATFADDLEHERGQANDIRSELERRMTELQRQFVEQRHLKADLAVKEAFITELRQATERAAVVKDAAVAEGVERTRAASAALGQTLSAKDAALAAKDAALTALQRESQEAERRMSALRQQLSVAQGDLARTQEALERLQVFASSAGFRMVSKATRTLNRYPRTYRMLQGIVRKVAGKPEEKP